MFRYLVLLALSLGILVLDQITKRMAYENLMGQPAVDVLPIFSLVLVFNEGAAFGFLNDAGGWQHYLFISLASVFSVILLIWIWRERERNLLLASALALVLGGAVGNLADRLMHGFVIDFLLLHYGGWTFPAFNVADIAITMGAILLILDSLLFNRH